MPTKIEKIEFLANFANEYPSIAKECRTIAECIFSELFPGSHGEIFTKKYGWLDKPTDHELRIAANDGKLHAIKAYKARTNQSLMVSKWVIEYCWKFSGQVESAKNSLGIVDN